MKKMLLLTLGMGVFIFLFTYTPAVSAEDGEIYEVDADTVNVRSSPSQEADIIDTLNESDRITAFQESFGWIQTYYDGQEAWVASQFLAPSNDSDNQVPKTSPDTANESKTDNADPLAGRTVVLDPGHGGKDPGALSLNNSEEKDYALDTANKASEKLQEAGADVILTRTDDTYLSLSDRASMSETENADAFISIHYNSFVDANVQGFGAHYHTAKDEPLAQNVQSGLENNLALNSRGTEESNYHVLRENATPAALLELGYITNANDLSHIQTNDFQKDVGDGITEGLADYFE